MSALKKDPPFTGGWFAFGSALIFLWLLFHPPLSHELLGALVWLIVLVFTGVVPIYWLILSICRYISQEMEAHRERKRGPLLTWKSDPNGEGLWRAELNGVAYFTREGFGTAWLKRGYTEELLGIAGAGSMEAARAMCERHARDPHNWGRERVVSSASLLRG